MSEPENLDVLGEKEKTVLKPIGSIVEEQKAASLSKPVLPPALLEESSSSSSYKEDVLPSSSSSSSSSSYKEDVLPSSSSSTTSSYKEDVLPSTTSSENILVSSSSSSKEEEENEANFVTLQLGDVILIRDPANEILDNNVFLIEYIDNSKIKLIGETELNQVQLRISPEGIIGDGTITQIELLSRNDNLGYAKQNGLLPGVWINIYFGGDIPTIITGEITNLEEDMIEVKTIPDNKVIYLNFDYKGIPENIPIETIEIRSAPTTSKKITPLEEEEDVYREDVLPSSSSEDILLSSSSLAKSLEEEIALTVPKDEIKQTYKQLMLDADDLVFGDYLGAITQQVTVDKEKQRFSVESQANDMLEELVSKVPNEQRTRNVLNNIHTLITRFIQLREQSSEYDENHNVIGQTTNKITANHKPLVNYLASFKNKLYWLLLVARNMRKVYNTDGSNDEYSDVVFIEQNDDFKQIQSFFESFKSNAGAEEQNKYLDLYNSLNPYMTPFSGPNEEDIVDNVIIESAVEDDLNVVINNLNELYSSISYDSLVKSRRFVIEKYNLGLNRLQVATFKGSKMIGQRVKLTPNDTIAINSILTLPEPAVRFSQINLPGSNMLVKANLNLNFLNYWQLLKFKTNVNTVTVEDLDTEFNYNEGNFVDDIKNFAIDLDYVDRATTSNLQIYKNFLNVVIPKTRILFSLIKKYIVGRLSLVDVIGYMEPFMIYSSDLSFIQYGEITDFLRAKIKQYNKNFVTSGRAFSILRGLKGFPQMSNPLMTLLKPNEQIENIVMSKYGYPDRKSRETEAHLTGSEFLRKAILADFGNLYNTGVAFENISLMYPKELSQLFEYNKEQLKEALKKDSAENQCVTHIIAKRYTSIEELELDNNHQIYFDKEFDTTPYTILDDFVKEQATLGLEEFKNLLTNKLESKYKYNKVDSEYIADSLINGHKAVREGQYAIIATPESGTMYFKRDNNIWRQDNSEIKKGVGSNEILCLVQDQCLYTANKTDGQCDSLEMTKDTIVSNALKNIIEQFDKKYEVTQEKLNKELKNQLEYYSKVFDKLDDIQRARFYKTNNFNYNLGLEMLDEASKIVKSPYTKLRDIILGQSDFVKKQNDILTFARNYTYEGNANKYNENDKDFESEFWLYCNQTYTKLLPAFLVKLADAFIFNESNYDTVMNNIILEQGAESDDGDRWVDKHSGYTIKMVDFDLKEGYEEGGFKIVTRSVLEKELSDALVQGVQAGKQDKVVLTPQGQIVANVITAMESFMGVNLEDQRTFIIKTVTDLINDPNILEKEPLYNRRVEEAAKKGKKLPPYQHILNSTMLYLTLGSILIGIQTSIPSIRTRKTFPGCVRSFDGFPLQGEGDFSSLQYIACVAYNSIKNSKNVSTVKPWNVLVRMPIEKISENIKTFIVKYLLVNQEIMLKIRNKIEYLESNPDDFIPEEHSLVKWTSFLPPLSKFEVKHLENVSDEFIDELKNDIKIGSHNQFEKIDVIESKIFAFSLAIQEAIQKIVEQKELILRTAVTPYMDNACCNEKDSKNISTLQYFVNDNEQIGQYNEIVYSLGRLLYDVKLLTKAPQMFIDIDSKMNYPPVTKDYSEETIYRAFIVFCKFNSLMPMSRNLIAICKEKPEYLSFNDSIQEQIAKLKRDSRNYSVQDFLRLLQIVNRENIIPINIDNTVISPIQALRDLFTTLNDIDDETIAPSLRNVMEKLLDTFDVAVTEDTPDMRTLKNYLQRTNGILRKQLLDFISAHSKLKPSDLKKVTKFIDTLSNWAFFNKVEGEAKDDTEGKKGNTEGKKDRKENSISNDGMYNSINFFKNFVVSLGRVFPEMILNKQEQTIMPHKYWKLSQIHNNDLINIVTDYYKPIKKFYGNAMLTRILEKIQRQTENLIILANETPAMTDIKIGEKRTYSVFDKAIITYLYEHYILQVFTDYINLAGDKSLLVKSAMVEKQMKFDYANTLQVEQEEVEYTAGDMKQLKDTVASLLVGYIKMMIDSKSTINLSYDNVMDRVFKLKEKEKDLFTDRLQSMTDEQRNIENVLKMNKLGVWSKGLSKSIKEYDADNYDEEREVMNNLAKIEKNVKKNANVTDANFEMYADDFLEDQAAQEAADKEVYDIAYMNDDYNDGDPWGEEQEDRDDYN